MVEKFNCSGTVGGADSIFPFWNGGACGWQLLVRRQRRPYAGLALARLPGRGGEVPEPTSVFCFA